MELHSHNVYNQIVQFVKQLSKSEKLKLVSEIEKGLETKSASVALQEILLNGPTWTEEEYNKFCATHEQVNRFPGNDPLLQNMKYL